MVEWLILVCLNCDVDQARATHWRSETALIEPERLTSWRLEDARRFATHTECLSALRRDHPPGGPTPPDEFGEITVTTHYRDHVERFASIPGQMNGAEKFACFSADHLSG